MAFNSGNSSDEQVIVTRKLYTGLADFRIAAVNPTQKQAEKLGINMTKEPTYLGKDKEGNPQCRVDFWLKEKTGLIPLTKISFFLNSKAAFSEKSGKTMFINKAGETGWGLSLDDLSNDSKMDWFNTDGAREALRGEGELTDFIKAFLNINPREEGLEARFETVDKMASKGDIKELRDIVNEWEGNEIRLLCGVKESDGNYYQDFFFGYFGRPSVTGYKGWKKAISNDFSGIENERYAKVAFGNSLELTEFIESADVGGPSSDGITAPGTVPQGQPNPAAKDDVPF